MLDALEEELISVHKKLRSRGVSIVLGGGMGSGRFACGGFVRAGETQKRTDHRVRSGSSTQTPGGALPLSWPRPTERMAREPGGRVAELWRFGGLGR